MSSPSCSSPIGDRQEQQTQSVFSPPWQHALDAYAAFQLQHRGVSTATVVHHSRVLRRFVAHLCSGGNTVDPAEISVAHIDDFIISRGRQRGRHYARLVGTALRGFLSFLALEGVVRSELVGQVPTTRNWSLATLPRCIDWDDVLVVLDGMPRNNAVGRRNYAILLVLAPYGIRASDVASLKLEDLHWRDSKVVFAMGKNGRLLALPLLDVVGDALAEYLRRDRAQCAHREVFLSLQSAPHPLTGKRISQLARAALERANVERVPGMAAHTFRHSLATQLVRLDTNLKVVGDCLGHASTETTFLYAKLAVDDLRAVALDPHEVLR